MEYQLTTASPHRRRTNCLILGVHKRRQLSAIANEVDAACGRKLSALLRRGDFPGQLGQTLLIPEMPGLRAERVLLVGCGPKEPLSKMQFLTLINKALQALRKTGTKRALNTLGTLEVQDQGEHWKLRQMVLASEQLDYRFDQYRSRPQPRSALRQIEFLVEHRTAKTKQSLQEALAISEGVAFCKDLANQPPNVCTPSYLAKQAGSLKNQSRRIETKVLGGATMEKMGMGALMAVGQGSEQPPKLIVVSYRGRGAGRNAKKVALVGKGVTFDTGGISIKPAANMDEMKFDMCGAASVLGTMLAAARLQLPLHLVGIIAAVENMPGGGACRPGDIVTSMSGQTIEILNTDAEGRLILSDALSYAEKFKPDTVIDIATLTGACLVALGNHASGLLSNHQPLADALIQAGEHSHDRVWQLPLWEEYQQQLKSAFADMGNIGGRYAGTITAACFLSRFAEKYHWAHLDIAGTAWISGEKPRATGRPVPLLTEYLLELCS